MAAAETEVSPFPFHAARRSFTGSSLDDERIAIRYLRAGEGELSAEASFGPRSAGAPGIVHGGAVLTVLDEAMGAACWVRGLRVLTARLSAAFRRGVPVGRSYRVETVFEPSRGRLFRVTGRLIDSSGVVYADAEGSFVRLTESQFRARFSTES
ncbi:MAG: PaaI family thioesterase [Elusimicrobia bacterium]|nr:PaaI family thioesterase [Elusimicrobiota bacterium]